MMMKFTSRSLFFACLIIQVHCYSTDKPNRIFRCHNNNNTFTGGFVNNKFFCDGDKDCADGEDEHFGCIREGSNACGAEKFACDNFKCKNVTVRCNTITDCEDGTDEVDCGDEVDVKNCTSEDKFLCHDGLRCLDIEYTCDGECNCFDCSDENDNCSKYDHDLLKECPHAYFITPNGPQCICKSSNTSSGQSCKHFDGCRSHPQYGMQYGMQDGRYYLCEQRCITLHGKQQCSCFDGYHPINGTFGSRCRTSDGYTILYATEFAIKSVNNTSEKTSTILHGINNCTLLTAANNYVYYATLLPNNKGSIFKMSLNSNKPEKIIETDFPITSIKVDYITNNVYFTSNGSLSVCTSDGRFCTRLKCCNVNSVTLAPKSGWMFYVRENSNEEFCHDGSLLTRSNMDGSKETIRENDCFRGEVFMKMDESKSRIYLLDKHTNHTNLYNISLDSAMKGIVPLDTYDYPIKVGCFSFHSNEIFFTKYEGHTIFSTKGNWDVKYSFRRSEYMFALYSSDNDTSRITDLYVHNAAIQRSDENPCENSSCSSLCLLKPEMQPSKYFLSHTCFCNGFTPTDDNHWCSDDTGVAIVWIVVCILLLIILGIVGCYMFSKYTRNRPSSTTSRIDMHSMSTSSNTVKI